MPRSLKLSILVVYNPWSVCTHACVCVFTSKKEGNRSRAYDTKLALLENNEIF